MLCDDKCQPGSEGVRLDLAPKNMIKLLKTLYYRYITDDFFFHHASINFIMKILVITRYISTFMASVPQELFREIFHYYIIT